MNRTLGIVTLFASLVSASADTLYLRNGPTMEGSFMGATTQDVKFKGRDGAMKTYSIANVEAVEVGLPPPTPAKSKSKVVIPAGTVITVRAIDNIDSTQTKAGAKYRASIDDPVVVGN